jgi:peptidoglycan/xylan/chitin deacetylase (PgdA/CDA1 family)
MLNRQVLILNYHFISSEADKTDLFAVRSQVFKNQLSLIRDLSVPVIPLGILGEEEGNYPFSLALTFDDGYHCHYREVAPLLEEYNFSATFFPIVNLVGTRQRLSWKELRQLAQAGFDIGSHGLSHAILKRMPLQDQLKELNRSKKVIEEETGKKVDSFAVPYGVYDEQTIQMAKWTGYRRILLTGLKINQNTKDNTVYYRWNITNKTSLASIKEVLCSKGHLPAMQRMSTALKQGAKQLLGPELAHNVNRMFGHG